MPDIDPTAPLDNDIVSAYPANERASRAAIEAIIGEEHDDATGVHAFGVGSTATRDGITNWEQGSLFYNTTTSRLEVQIGVPPTMNWVAAVVVTTVIPATTRMLFVQAAAPTGWTQVAANNDVVLRHVSGTGAGTGGSWTISGVSVNGTSLTKAQLPATPLKLPRATSGSGSGAFLAGGAAAFDTDSENLGAGDTHTHTLTIGSSWRPAYIDVISCTKDA